MSVPFEYAVLRAVPLLERGESVNVAVLVYCQARDFLGCAGEVAPERLLALDPAADVESVRAVLTGVRLVCSGDPRAGAAGAEPLRARFGLLTAPRSTVVQPGPVHTGMTDDPAAELAALAARLVAPPVAP
ncbi:DUF3037 domain-containing protein [Spongisporangium articulatum]|uniref:DUF3037 domain-containing protein n=1 Tax=Spongisporangium articulatum TaxID=3362603 RepID=A0ABW8AJA0_9ACTN